MFTDSKDNLSADDTDDGDAVAEDASERRGDVGLGVGVGDGGVVAPKGEVGVEGVDLHEAHGADEEDDADDPVRDQEEVEPLFGVFRLDLVH